MGRPHALTPYEIETWEKDGFVVRHGVFTAEENDQLRQVAEDIVDGTIPFPRRHTDRNALVEDGKQARSGIHAMHKIHHPSTYNETFLQRVRDSRLTDPVVDLLGPDVLGINNAFLWKAPEIGLGFPWHQDKFYFGKRFKTATTVGTWTAIDRADEENGCLYVIPGSHRKEISEHDDLEGSQQQEFKLARGVNDDEGVPVETDPGSVIWFHSHLLHKSTDNHSQRFRRSYVSHYLSARAEWQPEKAGSGQPIMWARGETFEGCVQEVHRDVLPVAQDD